MKQQELQLIIINGTSCAGKSSAVLYVRDNLKRDFTHFTWDSFRDRLLADKSVSAKNLDLVKLFTNEACARLDNGENLILDIVCIPGPTSQRIFDAFNAYTSLMVRMRASIEVLRERELLRPDRRNGQAEEQHLQMYGQEVHPEYDVELNSTVLTIEQIGDVIVNKVSNWGRQPTCC